MQDTHKYRFFLTLFFLTSCFLISYSQTDGRVLLRGKVLYRSNNVSGESVFNSTAETYTITNDDGQFAILVKKGDQLVFTAVNYELEVVTITDEILENNRLVVEVKEKVRELDEVVVSPEDQEKFLEVKNEEFKEFTYDLDRSAEVENVALSRADRGMRDGINFVNIFKAITKPIFKSDKDRDKNQLDLKISDVLRQIYPDEFFLVDLKLPEDKIDAFLFYVDDKVTSKQLLRKENEFELIDFLVSQSKDFMADLDEN